MKNEEKQDLEEAMTDAENPEATLTTEKEGRAQSDHIIRMIEIREKQKTISLFQSELCEPYVRLEVNGHSEIWPCKSRTFKRWLAHLFWRETKKTLRSDSLNTALTVIEGKAVFDGPKYALSNRVAWHEDALWYDLTDSEWRTVRITKEGWDIVKNPPLLFRRYTHQKPQCEPVVGGDVRLLLKHLNIAGEKQRLLFLVWVISCLIPNIPHPILLVYGTKGSAKSSLCRFHKRITDPSEMEMMSFPTNEKEFVQLLAHNWCLAFDNVSYISHGISDLLCKAVTGGGLSKRELYTDDDDVIYRFSRCIVINGINQVASRPDILERSILLELERVSAEKRKTEKALFTEFEKDIPQILGGIFTVLQRAMQIEPAIELPSMPRMADFTRWGCAIAEALGHTHSQFLDAYHENIRSQNEEVLNESHVATAVLQFMEDKNEWRGTPSWLLKELTTTADMLGINTSKERSFPKAANTLSQRLNELKTNLSEAGILLERGTHEKQREIYLTKETVSIVAPPASSEISTQVTDDTTNDDHTKPSGLSSPKNDAEQTPKDRGDDGDAGNDACMDLETF